MSLLQYLADRRVIDVPRDRLSSFRDGIRGDCYYRRACGQVVSVHLVDGVAGFMVHFAISGVEDELGD